MIVMIMCSDVNAALLLYNPIVTKMISVLTKMEDV